MAKKYAGENTIQEVITKTKQALNNKADSSQLANYLPLSGGTVTGNLKLQGTNNSLIAPIVEWDTGVLNDMLLRLTVHAGMMTVDILDAQGNLVKGYNLQSSVFAPFVDNYSTNGSNSDLGYGAYKGQMWRHLYLYGNISDGTNSVSVTDINNYIKYTTTAPASANTTGLKIALLDSEPATKYDGWIYLIKES